MGIIIVDILTNEDKTKIGGITSITKLKLKGFKKFVVVIRKFVKEKKK